MKKARKTYIIAFCVLLFLEVCIGLFVHDRFIRPYVGDVLITILFCCLCRIFFPKGISILPILVFLFAALVEVAQYFDIVGLLGLQNNAIISTIIGRTFSWIDLLCYGIGCLIFWLSEVAVKHITTRNKHS